MFYALLAAIPFLTALILMVGFKFSSEKSLIISLAAGYILIFVFQPLFLMGLFKKHGIRPGTEQDDRVI